MRLEHTFAPASALPIPLFELADTPDGTSAFAQLSPFDDGSSMPDSGRGDEWRRRCTGGGRREFWQELGCAGFICSTHLGSRLRQQGDRRSLPIAAYIKRSTGEI